MLKVMFFVDGQNFKKNLQTFAFKPFESEKTESSDEIRFPKKFRLDEKHFLWQKFFFAVLERLNKITSHQHRLIRVCWYNAQYMTPYWRSDRAIKKIMDEYKDKLSGLSHDKIAELAERWYRSEKEYFNNCKDKVYDQIQLKSDFIEFKYCGQYAVNPFYVHRFYKPDGDKYFYQGTRIGEKGVDVGIAIDMVAKMPNYDVAVLVSGDADFIPVVRYIKDNCRQVYQFSIAEGIPPEIKYLSTALRGIADAFAFFDELELLGDYLDRKSGIPDVILKSIDSRISYLKAQKR